MKKQAYVCFFCYAWNFAAGIKEEQAEYWIYAIIKYYSIRKNCWSERRNYMNGEWSLEALYSGYEDPAQGEHLGYQGPYHPHQAAALLRQAENV